MADRPPSVARRARQTVHLWVESLRDMLTSVGPVLLFALALLAAAYWWLDPQPPRTVTLATGPAGSGVPELMRRLLLANGLGPTSFIASELPPKDAAEAHKAGQIDALVLMTAPESPTVQRLLLHPGVALAEVPQADALSRRFPFLQSVALPRGMVDLARGLPPEDVGMLAATTALLTRDDTHPALRQLFAQAAQQIHGGAGWFNGARDFPNTRTSELPVSTEGDRAINGTPPFWQRYLPFWASNLLERMWLVVGGLIVLLLPISRVVPPLYTYRVRQRVFRWYARLQAVEARMEEGDGDATELLNELDELDRVASQISVPLAHADELYALRSNIEKTRRRLLGKRGQVAKAACCWGIDSFQ